MAVRTKMSTARSRGRAVVKTTSEKLPEEKPKEYGGDYRATRKEGVDYSIADVSPEDDKLIRKYLRVKDDEDYVIPKADYDVWKSSGRKSPEEYNMDISKGKPNPFQANYEGDVGRNNLVLQMYGKGKAPKAKPDPQNMRDAARKVKPLDKFATLKTKKVESGKSRDLAKAYSNPDIKVPEQVEGPKGRTVTRKKLAIDVKPNTKRDYRRQLGSKDLDRKKGIVVKTEDKYKGPRLSEKMKYKKEEKLAGARERVLGMSGVATEDQTIKYGKKADKNNKNITGIGTVKRGEKYKGSAERIKNIKNIFSPETDAMTDANLLAKGRAGMESRKTALTEAKSDVKQIGKLSRDYKKQVRLSGTKGTAKSNVKSLREEYRAAKKSSRTPAKFSKGTSTESLKQDLAAMSAKAKTPAELKAMKSNIKAAAKTARSAKDTSAEKESKKIRLSTAKGLAKEARSYKGDIRKGLRMEKMDARAMKVADKASDAKKARKAEKGRTMRGTSYFTMDALNKTTSLGKKTTSQKQAGTKRYKN